MTLDMPFWVKQRQIKVEELTTGTYRLTGPNLHEGVVAARVDDAMRWQAVLRTTADGPEVAASSASYDSAREALQAAFELYRTHFIV